MQAVQVQHYLRRATDFFEGMQLTRNEEPFRNSSALLAIHAAVSFSDALRVGLGDEELAADDHTKAADKLAKRIPLAVKTELSGIEHLRYLLGSKTAVAYGDRHMEAKTADLLVLRAQRFAAWANETGKRLGIEEWQDGDQG